MIGNEFFSLCWLNPMTIFKLFNYTEGMLYLLSLYGNSTWWSLPSCWSDKSWSEDKLKCYFFNEFSYVFYICLLTIVISFTVKWQCISFTNIEVELNFVMLYGIGVFSLSKVMPVKVLTFTAKFCWWLVLYFRCYY